MCINRLWALAALGLFACSSDPPPDSKIVSEAALVVSPLTQIENASLIAAGDGFALAGYDNVSGQVRWARISKDGVLSHETGFGLPAPVLGPYFAVAGKTEPVDQLITLALYASATVTNGYDLQAIVQDLDAEIPAPAVVLATLPTQTDPKTVRITAGTAKSGNMGFVAWGTKVQGIPIQYLLLGADASKLGQPGTAFGNATSAANPLWDCLAPTNGPTGLGFSIANFYPSVTEYTEWDTVEMDETGAQQPEMSYAILARVTDCRIVGTPTAAGGYDIAFENTPGIGVAFYYPPGPALDGGTADTGSVTTYNIAIPAGSFGSPLNAPHPAWAAPAGNDIAIGLSRLSGPEVTRFTYQAVPHGSTLFLRSANGDTGTVSAWVGPDLVYATYIDRVAASAGSTNILRYFAKIQAPVMTP